MSMSTIESMESLHQALEPLGVARTEDADLGEWVHDSFAALEKLHEELTQWQSELARKETQLDLRADALEKSPQDNGEVQSQLTQLEEELATVKEDTRLLEEERVQQLIDYENLVSKYAQVKADLQSAYEQVGQLVATIDSQRHASEQERELWQQEFQQLHTALDNHYAKLIAQLERSMQQETNEKNAEPDATTIARSLAKSAELRQRAQSRLKARE